ncbi:hypothetical protein DOY81_011931 [Sarcophaga bullata]|nr:hypothetical protein DOY81_011931 [Sarcophaga bullata]
MVFRTIISFVGSKRVPLIKFRKGGNQSSAPKTTASQTTQHMSNAIEDWELPPRYARKPISAEEMEYINNVNVNVASTN